MGVFGKVIWSAALLPILPYVLLIRLAVIGRQIYPRADTCESDSADSGCVRKGDTIGIGLAELPI